MRKKILNNLLVLTVGGILLTLIFCSLWMYRQVTLQVQQELRQDAVILTQGLQEDRDFFKKLPPEQLLTRVTLIDAKGRVLFDNETDAALMANHNNREEVAQARAAGSGSSYRRSATLSRDIYYYAQVLPDGKVLRVARSADSIPGTVWSFLPVAGLMVLLLGLAAYFLARRLTAKLVDPLDQVDLDQPLKADTYDELEPFLERIDAQNKALLAANSLRREFTANVSHELKTPLQSISGYAEIIGNGIAKPEDVPRFIGKISQEVKRLIEMVDNIMKLSKLDEGALNQDFTELDLDELIREQCQKLQPMAVQQQIKLNYRGWGQEFIYQGVPYVLEELVYNLVENALKYNRPGGRVQVTLERLNDGKARLIVRDTGIGIAPEDKDRIFERFYRGEKSHSNTIPGNGLGLSIVKHGVQLHQGTITVSSIKGEGTSMTVVL